MSLPTLCSRLYNRFKANDHEFPNPWEGTVLSARTLSRNGKATQKRRITDVTGASIDQKRRISINGRVQTGYQRCQRRRLQILSRYGPDYDPTTHCACLTSASEWMK